MSDIPENRLIPLYAKMPSEKIAARLLDPELTPLARRIAEAELARRLAPRASYVAPPDPRSALQRKLIAAIVVGLLAGGVTLLLGQPLLALACLGPAVLVGAALFPQHGMSTGGVIFGLSFAYLLRHPNPMERNFSTVEIVLCMVFGVVCLGVGVFKDSSPQRMILLYQAAVRREKKRHARKQLVKARLQDKLRARKESP